MPTTPKPSDMNNNNSAAVYPSGRTYVADMGVLIPGKLRNIEPVKRSVEAVALFSERVDTRLDQSVPVGVIQMYVLATAPTGWLMCNGLVIPDGTEYDALRALIGVNTPNLQGRTPVGLGTTGTAGAFTGSSTVLGTGGAATQALTVAQLAAHSHGMPQRYAGDDSGDVPGLAQSAGSYTARVTADDRATSDAGSGAAHNNMQPYFVANYIIKF